MAENGKNSSAIYAETTSTAQICGLNMVKIHEYKNFKDTIYDKYL